jgi:predicted HicB family RNase H-like nuclease
MSPSPPDLKLRLPADLADELRRRAEEQGISLNSLIIALLAGAVKFSLKKKDR